MPSVPPRLRATSGGFLRSNGKETDMRDGKLVAGQIGCGGFAKDQDIPNLKGRGDVFVGYCCDASAECAERAARELPGAKAVTDYLQVLDDPEVDFVKVSTPHDTHRDIVLAAAARGKHVFCEKPMAMNLEDCWEIVRAVRKGGIRFCVDMNRRMSPAMRALKARVAAQAANPRHSPWRYVEMSREPMFEETRTNFLMRMQDESSSYRLVHLDPAHGGGEVIGESVHWLDLACWFFAPARPVEITGWGTARLSHGINVLFSDGNAATIIFDACGTFDYPKEMYEVTSNAALFRSMFFVENRYYGMDGEERETFPLQFDAYADSVKGDGFDAFMEKSRLRQRAAGAGLKAAWGALGVDKGHRAMLDGFVEAVKTGGATPCDEMAGMRAVLLSGLAVQAIRERRAVAVPVDLYEPVFA